MLVINQKNNNFHGIKLSNNSTDFARSIASYLDTKGFCDLGKGDIFQKCPALDNKAKIAQKIRDGDLLYHPEFATVFFHAEDEAYIVGCDRLLEQKMIPFVLEKDPKASINLMI
jgi:hypothetical protein